MSNDYYNADTLISRHSKAKSPVLNTIFQAIASGFGLLPAKDKLHQDRVTHYSDTGTADAYVVTMVPVPTSYVDGLHLRVVIANTNTGAATINVNELGARSIKIFNNTDPAAGDLTAGDVVDLVFHGARNAFIMTSQSRAFVASAQSAQEAAESAAEAAAGSEESAAVDYLAFSKRMLGEHAEDPTTDNEGDLLLVSAIYWKTGEGWKVWNGSKWNPAVFDAAGAMFAANNLSDLANAKASISNLGLKFTISTTTATAQRFDRISADVSGGAWTLTLPASPAAGEWVEVVVVSGDPTTNALTVDAGAKTINGDATLVMDALNVLVTLIYNGIEWRIG